MSKVKMSIAYEYRKTARRIIAEADLAPGADLYVYFSRNEITASLAESKTKNDKRPYEKRNIDGDTYN